MTTPLPMSLAVRFLFKSPCMNGPAGGPTSRAVGATNHPIRIAAPAQKPPATISITRSVVIIMSFYHNVDVPTRQTGCRNPAGFSPPHRGSDMPTPGSP